MYPTLLGNMTERNQLGCVTTWGTAQGRLWGATRTAAVVFKIRACHKEFVLSQESAFG